MFTGVYTKIASLILQIVLVVAAVLIFAYFDPFGLLTPKKQTLEDTPITVVSIKEIGQLVTAEYYGEVLSSLQDTLIAEVKASDKTLVDGVGRLNENYIKALRQFYARKDSIEIRRLRRKKDLVENFYNANPALINDPFYQDMIEAVLGKEANKFDNEGELLLDLWKKNTVDFTKEPYLSRYKFDKVTLVKNKETELADLKSTRSFKKRQLIAIGRGWVKAGIDFGSFTERNFKYDKAGKTIYLFGVKPVILDYDINPWFIPEKKVRGFEIIAATNRANDPGSLLKVKEHCLNKLRAQAETNGIIAQARINAEETLKSFFSLLIGEPIEKVQILEISLVDFYKEIPEKGLISRERLPLLDSILLGIDKFDRDSAVALADRLTKREFDTGVDTFLINRFSALTFAASEDEIITQAEWAMLQNAMHRKNFSHADSIWFSPRRQYNKLLADARARALKQNHFAWYDSVTASKEYLAFEKTLDTALRSNIYKAMTADRDSAIKQSLALLKRYVKTINTTPPANCTENVEVCLDRLAK